MRPKNFDDVFNAPDLFIGKIVEHKGIIAARALLFILISEVVNYFNVGKNMNDKQVATTCDLIIDYYSYFKPEDFKLCFKNAMIGKYGKQYDRIDGAVIMEWLKEYEKERIEHAIVHSENEAKKLENEINESNLYQEYLVNLNDRSKSGDEEAKKQLQNHLEIESFLKSSGYNTYAKEREKQKLYGRGIEYEKQFNRNLINQNRKKK